MLYAVPGDRDEHQCQRDTEENQLIFEFTFTREGFLCFGTPNGDNYGDQGHDRNVLDGPKAN